MANKEITAFDFFGDELELVDAKARSDINTINTQLENIENNKVNATYDVASEKITITSNKASYDEVNKRIVLS